MEHIRNFSIIAHVDHGKSTLADRLIELCGKITHREMQDQILDSMPLERERGITIKAQTVCLEYRSKNGNLYQLNIMDTPGHVDFAYEVSRSLIACEGSLLVVDATQGVEAQTIANVQQALQQKHLIIPVLNKIDLPSADPVKVLEEIRQMIGLDCDNNVQVSAKTGQGIPDLLEAIVNYLPPPEGSINAPLQALLVDSWYDKYLGIVILIRVKNGVISLGDEIMMISNRHKYTVESLGVFLPKMEKRKKLLPGEIGFITAAIKDIDETAIGDTITHTKYPTVEIYTGFQKSKPVVFCGLYPKESTNFHEMKKAVAKLKLNDKSFHYEVEQSTALGAGFRCGFLGLLHMDIICERLKQESNIELIATAPSIIYKLNLANSDKSIYLNNPEEMPNPSSIKSIEEPWIRAIIVTHHDYLGSIMKLCESKRGKYVDLSYINTQAMLTYDLPLNEIVFSFNDKIKSLSKGLASFNYEFLDYQVGKLVKITIIVHNQVVDGLSFITHVDSAYIRGKEICEKLKNLIPRHQFTIAIQAAINGKIIARETIASYAKGVTDKLYGGDRTRKMKLLEKQKEGKRQMQALGKVNIPQQAFLAVTQIDNKD